MPSHPHEPVTPALPSPPPPPMPPYGCVPPRMRPEPFSPLPRPGKTPDWGKWIRDRLAEKGALLAFPTRTAFPSAGSAPNLYLAEDTGVVYRWGGEGYAVLVDPSPDVETYPGRSAFPDTGRAGVIYIDASTNLLYRWGGTGYVLLTSDLSGVESRLADVESKVPAQATAQNQLADKAFVNSSIATNTAFYISDNGGPFQSLADLESYEGALTNNDYAFVVGRDAAGNTTYTRYKWNEATEAWGEEYVLNNSSFTAEQWAAISSGITSGLVAKLGALPTAEALAQALAGKASKADTALTERWAVTFFALTDAQKEAFSLTPGASDNDYALTVGEKTESGTWQFYVGSYYAASLEVDANGNLVFSAGDARLNLQPGDPVATPSGGYILGPDDSSNPNRDKPLASEAEAEALRQGKQDALTFDNAPTSGSDNPVKSGGIWSAIWGALAALPAGFTSLYDWCVAQIAKLRDKLDLNVYEHRCVVSFPAGYSITYSSDTYTAPSSGESIEFYGPISSTAVPQYNFWVPYEYKDATDFDPQAQSAWCLYGDTGNSIPTALMYGTGASYNIANWDTEAPTLALSNGEATGGEPTMTRPLGATGDTLAKASQLAGKLGKSGEGWYVGYTGDGLRITDTAGMYYIDISPDGVRTNYPDTAHVVYWPITRGTLALLEDIAGSFSSSTAYAKDALVERFSVLYRCVNPNGHTGAWVDADFTPATVEDVLAALRTGKADVSAIPYDRITITTGQLQDHAEQKVTLNAATTTLALPALTDLTGKVSDFGIDMVNGYAPDGTPTAASFQLDGTLGTDYNLIVPDGEDWSEMSTLAAGEMAVYYFTLSAFQIGDLPTWGVLKQVVTLVPVPVAP